MNYRKAQQLALWVQSHGVKLVELVCRSGGEKYAVRICLWDGNGRGEDSEEYALTIKGARDILGY